jgi:long-chain acyl-CoA synthetase
VVSAPDPVAAVLEAQERRGLLVLRTSGTTGAARCVVRTTDSWFDSFDHVTRLMDLHASSRLWVPGPLTATMNLFAAVHARVVGATVCHVPEAASHAVLTPAALGRAVAHGAPLRGTHIVVAGDRLDRRLHDEALALPGVRVSHYYGAAELSFVAWGSHAGDLRPFPGVEMDTTDGRVWVRSPYVCTGYDGPDGPLLRRADGFVTVGDRGVLENGRLRVRGRGQDTVVTAGATVLVADVEAALEEATGVRPAVVGLPHPDLGEVVVGVVASAADVPVLREAARRLLSGPERPRRWFVVPELPSTRAGKVDRAALVEHVRRRGDAGARVRRTVDTL